MALCPPIRPPDPGAARRDLLSPSSGRGGLAALRRLAAA